MAFYVIRVVPRAETVFLEQSKRFLGDAGVEVFYLRRKLEQTKKGKKSEVEVPLFPGYVFLRTPENLDADLYRRVKEIQGFSHFIKHGEKPTEMQVKDVDLLKHFLKFGETAPVSQVVFDEQQKIRVLSGPMEGFEGKIVSVDRRKKRAKILLDFDHGQFYVTLGFAVMEGRPHQA